jgi:hypothetical protein
MASYQDGSFLFSASSLEATFSDGSTLLGGSSNFTTHFGDELWIVDGSEEEGPSQRIVRLIFIPPEQDWRRNQTYSWKLDSAWMSSSELTPDDESSDTRSWLHWNVESYINSAIQVPEDNNIFECDELELHFRPIRDTDGPYHTGNERLLLKDVRFGLHLPPNNGFTKSISPCSDHTVSCTIVDGEVQTHETPWDLLGGKIRAHSASTRTTMELEAGATLALCIAIIALCCYYWRRHQRSKLYQQLSPTPEEDLGLTVEETYQSSEPRSTIKGVINQTG